MRQQTRASKVADAWHSAAEAAERTPPLDLGVGAGTVEGRYAVIPHPPILPHRRCI
jgi:hypothetical protein